MSFYDNYQFFCVLIFILMPAMLLGILEQPLKWYSTAATFLFTVLAFLSKPQQAAWLALFFVTELFLVEGYLSFRVSRGRSPAVYRLVLFLSILPLILSKLAGFWDGSTFAFLGISYLTFRCVQIIIETYDGLITEMPVLDFAAFVLFFPSISSGPIDRSRRFLQDLNNIPSRQDYLTLAGEGVFKILLGLIYKLILASIFFKGMGMVQGAREWYFVIFYAYCYGFYLFFDFAGYSLMAIGTSYLLGIRTPENFRKPFLSVDIQEFWDRWHITLSHWFRDFLFSRFMIQSIRKKRFKTRLNAACAGFLVNMLVMGLWHGVTPSYILYGLYHGVLLAITEWYKKKSSFYKKYRQKRWYRFLSWLITLQLVIFGFYIFSGQFLWLLGLS